MSALWRRFLSETWMRFRLMLSSMSASAAIKWFFGSISETIRASNFEIYHNVAHDSLYMSTGNVVTIYIQCGANSANVSIYGPCSGRDFSTTAQPLTKKITVMQIIVQALHLVVRKSLDIFASWPWKWHWTACTVVNALNWWLISISWKAAEASASQIRSVVVRKSLIHGNQK